MTQFSYFVPAIQRSFRVLQRRCLWKVFRAMSCTRPTEHSYSLLVGPLGCALVARMRVFMYYYKDSSRLNGCILEIKMLIYQHSAQVFLIT